MRVWGGSWVVIRKRVISRSVLVRPGNARASDVVATPPSVLALRSASRGPAGAPPGARGLRIAGARGPRGPLPPVRPFLKELGRTGAKTRRSHPTPRGRPGGTVPRPRRPRAPRLWTPTSPSSSPEAGPLPRWGLAGLMKRRWRLRVRLDRDVSRRAPGGPRVAPVGRARERPAPHRGRSVGGRVRKEGVPRIGEAPARGGRLTGRPGPSRGGEPGPALDVTMEAAGRVPSRGAAGPGSSPYACSTPGATATLGLS
jgi:hypothetical protein